MNDEQICNWSGLELEHTNDGNVWSDYSMRSKSAFKYVNPIIVIMRLVQSRECIRDTSSYRVWQLCIYASAHDNSQQQKKHLHTPLLNGSDAWSDHACIWILIRSFRRRFITLWRSNYGLWSAGIFVRKLAVWALRYAWQHIRNTHTTVINVNARPQQDIYFSAACISPI